MAGTKISFQDFMQILSFDVVKKYACIEIEFGVDSYSNYQSCWLGKTINKNTNTASYWYGLVEDGSQAYDFPEVDEFINAKVFDRKSIKEIWNLIELYSIDACDVNERLPFYLEQESGAIRGPAC